MTMDDILLVTELLDQRWVGYTTALSNGAKSLTTEVKPIILTATGVTANSRLYNPNEVNAVPIDRLDHFIRGRDRDAVVLLEKEVTLDIINYLLDIIARKNLEIFKLTH